MSPLNGLWPLMANKVHFNPFIFSQHWLWTLSYLSSILHSFHLTDVLIIFSLPGGLRQCNNTAIALEWGCNKRTPPLPSTPPSMLTWLAEHTRLLVQSGTTSSSKSQSSLQLPVLVRATHITVPIKRWLCPQWLILWPQFMMSSTKGLFFFLPLTICQELTHWKRPWQWARLKAEGDDRGGGGRMASPTRWAWVWASSGSWWWTGRPGVLQSMGSQRVAHDWATELNWFSLLLGRNLQPNSHSSNKQMASYSWG